MGSAPDNHPRGTADAAVGVLAGLFVPLIAGCADTPKGPAPGAEVEPVVAVEGRRAWVKGKGWGWIWGKDDDVGALNAMTPQSVASAMSLARTGKVYDLGVLYDRTSCKWPGHSPCEIVTFRSPAGVKGMLDHEFVRTATRRDRAGTRAACSSMTTSPPKSTAWGIRRCGADTIPPIVARGVMIDVAGYKGVDALPSHYVITPQNLEGALKKQGTELKMGDTVLIRTDTFRYWAPTGADHNKLAEHDSACINLASARWLVELHGGFGYQRAGGGTRHSRHG